MLDITCLVGRFRNFIELDFPLLLAGKSIGEYFYRGSMDISGNPAINMHIDDRSMYNASVVPNERPTNAIYLQYALQRMVQNPPSVQQVDRIGLLIADQYSGNNGLLGLMFDQGFNSSRMDRVDPVYTRVPREGCAIFLNAIGAIRGTIQSFRDEVVFTAIHELGHVFNLWHVDNPISFMSRSDRESTYPPRCYFFDKGHRNFLHRAPDDPHVYPGGSLFESRGTAGPGFNNPLTRLTEKNDLTIRIKTSQEEFWYFEPIELDVIVAARKKTHHISDHIDPGYEDFIIHITRPDGTVFRYRSPRIYCVNLSTVTITPGKPFSRDISIFGQSGGYTFSSPGIYQIQCFLKQSATATISSNSIQVFVKAPLHTSHRFRQLEARLTDESVARLLYHRSGYFDQKTIDQLEDVSKRESRQTLGINLLYAQTRFETHLVGTNDKRRKSKLESKIKRSLDSGKLSENREKNLFRIQESMDLNE